MSYFCLDTFIGLYLAFQILSFEIRNVGTRELHLFFCLFCVNLARSLALCFEFSKEKSDQNSPITVPILRRVIQSNRLGSSSEKLAIEDQIKFCRGNFVIKEEIMDNKSLFAKDPIIKMEPIPPDHGSEMLKRSNEDEDPMVFFHDIKVLKHEMLDVPIMNDEWSDDHELLFNEGKNTEGMLWYEKLIKEELIIADGNVIKKEETTGFADFIGDALCDEPNSNKKILNSCEMAEPAGIEDFSDLLKTNQNCIETSKSMVQICEISCGTPKSVVCTECHTSFPIVQLSQNEKNSLVSDRESITYVIPCCDQCCKSKLRQQALRRKKLSTHNDLSNENEGMKTCIRSSRGQNPTVSNKKDGRSENLKTHQQESKQKYFRLRTDDTPFMCNDCNKGFASKHGLGLHLQIHIGEKPFECSECRKRFTLKKYLQQHILVHSSTKGAFECTECCKTFTQKNYLKRHVEIHTNGNPFECNECGRGFKKKFDLQRHIMAHDKPFSCKECSQSFSRKYLLVEHLQIHTGKKQYECSECSKKFALRGYLRQHIKTHSTKTRFECSDCSKRFAIKSNLKQHVMTHSAEKPFECSDCSRRFALRSYLKRHVMTHRS